MKKESILLILDIAFKTVTPWKLSHVVGNKRYSGDGSYTDGWNDCIKEIRKNRKNYIKKIGDL